MRAPTPLHSTPLHSTPLHSHALFDTGGYRESGFGRDGGKEGLYEYTRPKHLKKVKLDASKLDISSFGKVRA